MKIQYASDLHLEFHENSRWLRDNPLVPVGDILVLAGDIGYLGDEMYLKHPFWNWSADNFEQTLIVPGNHESYKNFDINELTEGWSEQIRSNVNVVYNKTVHLDNVDFILSTLWAKIHPAEAYFVEHGVTDFRRIRNGEYRLSWDRFNDEHERCVQFIKRSVEQSSAEKRVVITHHVPSFLLMADEFKGSLINGAFTSDLNSLIEKLPIDYWIYGHSHRNIDGEIGGTKIVSNQLGYVYADEIDTFKPDKYIEL
mgnify:CR=1 FL=1|jgi:metallophosphoesterase